MNEQNEKKVIIVGHTGAGSAAAIAAAQLHSKGVKVAMVDSNEDAEELPRGIVLNRDRSKLESLADEAERIMEHMPISYTETRAERRARKPRKKRRKF